MLFFLFCRLFFYMDSIPIPIAISVSGSILVFVVLVMISDSVTSAVLIAVTSAPGLAAISLISATPNAEQQQREEMDAWEEYAPCCCCCCCCCCLDDAPTISDFAAVYDPATDEWVFLGTVDDEDTANCTVTFGGLLDGHEAEVDEFGNFELRLDLEGEEGLVSAEVTDESGQVSESEYDDVQNA